MESAAPFDPLRFDAVVDKYVAHRTRYPARLIDDVREAIGLPADGLVLDLGCGPGFLAEAFAPMAGEIVGVDPSPSMIAAARATAPRNVRYVEGSSYTLPEFARPLDLVTMGRSFHWMDRDATLAALDTRVAPGASIALFDDTPLGGPAQAWWRAAMETALSFSVIDAHGQMRRSDAWEPHDHVLLRSAFRDVRRLTRFAEHEWTFDSVLGFILSRSTTCPELLGDNQDALRHALRDTLDPFGPGPWRSTHEHSALIATRP